MIEAYLASLRAQLGTPSADPFLAEVHDHLLEGIADGLHHGLDPAAAEARAIDRFGPPDVVARHYLAELAQTAWEKRMQMLRLIAVAFVGLTVYYVRFFVTVRQEGSTLIQIGVLLGAAAVLTLPARFRLRPGVVWPRGWVVVLVSAALAVAVFAWADHDSHSTSDTLNRAVPTICLIVAIALRLANSPEKPEGQQRRLSL